jgi:hypothetical protein
LWCWGPPQEAAAQVIADRRGIKLESVKQRRMDDVYRFLHKALELAEANGTHLEDEVPNID